MWLAAGNAKCNACSQGTAIPTLMTAINDASAAIEPWSYQPGPST